VPSEDKKLGRKVKSRGKIEGVEEIWGRERRRVKS
jgi:hypothetical protein